MTVFTFRRGDLRIGDDGEIVTGVRVLGKGIDQIAGGIVNIKNFTVRCMVGTDRMRERGHGFLDLYDALRHIERVVINTGQTKKMLTILIGVVFFQAVIVFFKQIFPSAFLYGWFIPVFKFYTVRAVGIVETNAEGAVFQSIQIDLIDRPVGTDHGNEQIVKNLVIAGIIIGI